MWSESPFTPLYGYQMSKATYRVPEDRDKMIDTQEHRPRPSLENMARQNMTRHLELKRRVASKVGDSEDSYANVSPQACSARGLGNPQSQQELFGISNSGVEHSGLDIPDLKRARMMFASIQEDTSCGSMSTVLDFSMPESSRVGTMQAFPRKSHNKLPSLLALQCPLLSELNPLGLKLRKSPSLVDLIQVKISQGQKQLSPKSSNLALAEDSTKGFALLSQQEKMKASHFPVSTLRIGAWERHSKHEGDVVAKCYFAKRKLVWEILEHGLKSKMEVQWDDITAMKSNCKNDEPGVLEIEVSRPPLFYSETKLQPRKHTLWNTSSDFTGGEATICKRHYLQFSLGVLNRHYENLLQFDPHLKSVSEKTVTFTGSMHFKEPRESIHGEYDMKQFPEIGPTQSCFIQDVDNAINNKQLPSILNTQPIAYASEIIHLNHPVLNPEINIMDFKNVAALKFYSISTDGCEENTIELAEKGGFEASEQMAYGNGQDNSANVLASIGMFEESLINPSSFVSPSPIDLNPPCIVNGSPNRKMPTIDNLAYQLLTDIYLTGYKEKQMDIDEAISDQGMIDDYYFQSNLSQSNHFQSNNTYHEHGTVEVEHQYSDLSGNSRTSSEEMMKISFDYGEPEPQLNYPSPNNLSFATICQPYPYLRDL